MTYHLTLEADEDLYETWLYGLGRWGLEQADNYQDQLEKMIRYLAENPQHGKDQSFIVNGLRSFPSGSHRVFYMFEEGYITVVRVLHQSMDTERHIHN